MSEVVRILTDPSPYYRTSLGTTPLPQDNVGLLLLFLKRSLKKLHHKQTQMSKAYEKNRQLYQRDQKPHMVSIRDPVPIWNLHSVPSSAYGRIAGRKCMFVLLPEMAIPLMPTPSVRKTTAMMRLSMRARAKKKAASVP